jgi:hypothetical protein
MGHFLTDRKYVANSPDAVAQAGSRFFIIFAATLVCYAAT